MKWNIPKEGDLKGCYCPLLKEKPCSVCMEWARGSFKWNKNRVPQGVFSDPHKISDPYKEGKDK